MASITHIGCSWSAISGFATDPSAGAGAFLSTQWQNLKVEMMLCDWAPSSALTWLTVATASSGMNLVGVCEQIKLVSKELWLFTGDLSCQCYFILV